MEKFIFRELAIAGLAHNIFTENALSLIVRSSDGILRKALNLALSCMIEAIRSRKKTIDIENVNKVLIQPHWRLEKDIEQIS